MSNGLAILLIVVGALVILVTARGSWSNVTGLFTVQH